MTEETRENEASKKTMEDSNQTGLDTTESSPNVDTKPDEVDSSCLTTSASSDMTAVVTMAPVEIVDGVRAEKDPINDQSAAENDQSTVDVVGEAGSSAENASTADGEGSKKKKKKRRKKKKKEGEKRVQAFTHLFEGVGRQHAFRVGEVIAGRVDRIDEGAIVVDLFGKAVAVADVREPREIPIIPVEVETSSKTESSDLVAETEAEVEAKSEAAEIASEENADADTQVETEEAKVDPAQAMPEGHIEASGETDVEAVASKETADAGSETGAETTTEVEGSEEEVQQTKSTEEKGPLDGLQVQEEISPPALGSIFRGRIGSVAESGHIAIVNRIIDRPQAKARIAAAREARQRVIGVVFGYNRGGFDVLVEGIRTFCPAGGMNLAPVEKPEEWIGKRFEFNVPVNKGSGKSIIVSRRGILERELRKKARARLKSLQVGERIEGAVLEVRDYGCIVDLGEGLDGLVHQSEVSWTRGTRPRDVVNVGDVVTVEVLKVQPASRKERQGRVSLSLRKCLPDPWEEHTELLTIGTIRTGKVVSTTEFGAFVELAPGIQGLLHISELGGKEIKHAKQVIAQDAEVEVMIERVDREQRRIGLSKLSDEDKKAIESGEWDPSLAPKSLKAGAYITVVVQRIENHGVVAQVRGVLGKRGRAFLPNRELSVEGPSRKKAYAVGKELEVKIINVDREGQLRCSIKARAVDEERKAVRDYRKEASKQGFGTFGDLLKAKLANRESSFLLTIGDLP